jgi:aspartate/tyrosine/aromatic aminotransferase
MEKITSDIILKLNEQAKKKEATGVKVINGTIGMMYLDDGHLPVSRRIREVLSHHTKDEDLCYSSVAGEEKYLSSLMKWFFGDSFAKESQEKKINCLGSMGGTGAISVAIRSASETKKTIVLLPSLCWPNYPAICNTYNVDHAFYNMFAGSHFDMDGLVSLVADSAKKYQKIILVINDPCQNPTGYCLTESEWKAIVALLNEASKTIEVSLLVDCAYIDFADASSRAMIASSIKSLNDSIVSYICMSFSKTFSFYGLRIGALGVYCGDSSSAISSFSQCIKEARALWSVPNHMASNAIGELLTNPETFADLKQEVRTNKEIVTKRASIFLKEAKEEGLVTYPYSFGFFISIPCHDALMTSLTLQKKNIFLAPVASDCLRVSLSCLPTEEVPGLAHEIKLAQ